MQCLNWKRKVTSWMNDAVMSQNQTNCCTLELGNPSQSDITFHEIPSCKPWTTIKPYHHLIFQFDAFQLISVFQTHNSMCFKRSPHFFCRFFRLSKRSPQQPQHTLRGWEELEAKSKELEVERRHLLNSFSVRCGTGCMWKNHSHDCWLEIPP